MALRDNPYIMLDVNDFMNDEKLRECSPASVGIYIRLLCVLHKSDTYGVLLYQQKDVQKAEICGYKNPNKIQIFVTMLSRQLPETPAEIEAALIELSEEGVIKITENRLEQKRMIRDAEISEKRQQARAQRGKAQEAGDVPEQEGAEFCNNKTANKKTNFVGTKQLTKSENLCGSRAHTYTSPSITTNTDINEGMEEEKGVQGEKEKSAAQIEADKVTLFVSLWHQHCPGLPKVQKLTQARRDKIRARLKDEPDLATWAEVFKKIAASSFCNGDNRQGWKASFDWITTNGTNYVKVLEGNYDRTANNTRPAGPSSAGSADPGVPADGYEDRL